MYRRKAFEDKDMRNYQMGFIVSSACIMREIINKKGETKGGERLGKERQREGRERGREGIEREGERESGRDK